MESELNELEHKPRPIVGKTPDYLSDDVVKFEYRKDYNNALGMWIADNIIRDDVSSNKRKKDKISRYEKKLRRELQNKYKQMAAANP